MKDVLERIFTVNLGVRPHERALVFTDLPAAGETARPGGEGADAQLRGIARLTAEAGRALCRVDYVEFPSTGGHGKEPPEPLWEAAFGSEVVSELREAGLLGRLLAKEADAADLARVEEVVRGSAAGGPDAVVALSRYSTSHTRFRDLLTRCLGARYASMPLFEKSMIYGPMAADWREVEARTLRLCRLADGGAEVHIKAPNGTDIRFSIEGRSFIADTGILTEPGSFGNLPAGEAFLAPVEETAEGVLVLEWGPTGRFVEPVVLRFEGGFVAEVSGGDPFAAELGGKIAAEPLVGNLAELGIGTNDRAARPDNILETEKILGTVHMAIGDNSSFGGRVSVPYHQDFVLYRPTVVVTKRGGETVRLLIDGKPAF